MAQPKKWVNITGAPGATLKTAEITVPFESKMFPGVLPAETTIPRPNLTAVIVSGKWFFTSNVQKGWVRPGDPKKTLTTGEHVFLEYNVPHAKSWSGVPLPSLHKQRVSSNCVYAGVVHDDQARLRISDDMTSIILRVSGRIPNQLHHLDLVPSIQVAKHTHELEPAGYLNHFCF